MKMEEYIRGIPSGLLTAQLGEREIQVVGISENGFEFRLEKKAARQLLTDAVPVQHQVLRDAAPPQHCIMTPFCKVCFYDLEQALWQELVLTEYGLEKAPALSQPRAQGEAVRCLLLSALSGLRNFAGVSDCCAEASFAIYPLHPSEAGRG